MADVRPFLGHRAFHQQHQDHERQGDQGEHEAESFVWRRPITFEAQSCGQPDLHWDLSTLCYEMAADFGHLYRGYGLTGDAFQARLPRRKK